MDMSNTVNIKFCDGRICVISLVGIMYEMCGLAIIHNILLWPKISKGKSNFNKTNDASKICFHCGSMYNS